MKPQLPALVMPLSTASGPAQAGSTLQRRVPLSDGDCGSDRASGANLTGYTDSTFPGPAGNIPSYAHDAAGLKRHNRHASLNVRVGKKRFG